MRVANRIVQGGEQVKLNASEIAYKDDGGIVRLLPYGLVVDSGSNEYGNYIKFGDGTMICYGELKKRVEVTTSFGSLYRTGNDELIVNYAKEFIDLPSTSFTSVGGGSSFLANQEAGTVSSQKLYFMRPTTLGYTTQIIKYIAIGRWKE